ncbi:MAG: hypothetical protein V3T08_09825 [Gemmatimonadota bacterium]
MSEPILVDIGPGDAALVFKADGVELFVPGLEDDAPVSPHVEEACAAALLLRGDDPRYVALRAQLESLFRQSCAEEAENG